MFDRDQELQGRHATYTKFLCNDKKVFKRYIDVYMVGAVMGILHARQAEIDKSFDDDARIFAAQFANERLKCEFIYQLIMLLDQTDPVPDEQRLDRAFRVDDSTPAGLAQNMDLFHRYVRGGIDVLHEMFEECTTDDDYITKMSEIVTSFDKDVNGHSYDELIKSIIGS